MPSKVFFTGFAFFGALTSATVESWANDPRASNIADRKQANCNINIFFIALVLDHQLLGAPFLIQSRIICTCDCFNAPVGGMPPDFTSLYKMLLVGTAV